MTDARTKEADLAAIASKVEFNCNLASSHFGDDPLVMAAVANVKATHEAFFAAVAEPDAARFFHRISADRHVRQCCVAADQASGALRFAVDRAELTECALPAKLITQDDIESYGEELIDLAKRAALEAMRPELSALRQELLSKLAAFGSTKTRLASPQPTRLITLDDVESYGEELIDLAKRAAQEAMRPELNALRRELLSEFPAAAG